MNVVSPNEERLIDHCQLKAKDKWRGRSHVNKREVTMWVMNERSVLKLNDEVTVDFAQAVANHIVDEINEGIMFPKQTT